MALALGQPVATLARVMGEAEFQEWQLYAATRMLPWRRMEMHLAQIAMWVATSTGSVTNVAIKDFLFDRDDAAATAEDEIEFFDFKPYKKQEQ